METYSKVSHKTWPFIVGSSIPFKEKQGEKKKYMHNFT